MRESVEDVARSVAVLLQIVADHAYHDRVGSQTARFDVALHALAQLGAARYLAADHLARRDMVDVVLLLDTRRLRAFAASGRSEQYYIQHKRIMF